MPLPLDPLHPSNHVRTAKNPLEVICSMSAEAKLLKNAARQHWSIGNSCHWVLDVTWV